MDDEFIKDFFAAEGSVRIRRMFGGKGVYLDDMIVAIVLGDELLLKSDERTAPLFEAAGGRRWCYRRDGKLPVAMPYFTIPTEALDDPDAMAAWARRAIDAAIRSRATSKPRKPRGPSRSA